MFRAVVLVACLASASAFAPSALLPRTGTRASISRGPRMQQFPSESVPFLENPPNLDGSLVGDIGFDPVGFSNYFDLRWLRESELKHGRVCMLGVLGLIVPEFVVLPQFKAGVTPVDSFFQIPAPGLWQIFFTIGAIEFFSHGFKLTPGDMFAEGRIAGDFGFDPLGFGKKQEAFDDLALKEIKHVRLAMIAFGGLLHQQLLYKTGTFAQLANFEPLQ